MPGPSGGLQLVKAALEQCGSKRPCVSKSYRESALAANLVSTRMVPTVRGNLHPPQPAILV